MPIWRMPSIKGEMGHRSDASVYNAIKAGLLTKPIKIGERAVGLPDYEVKAVTAARIAGKTDDEIRALVNRLHAKRAELTTV
jgi:prophage regulatory protein